MTCASSPWGERHHADADSGVLPSACGTIRYGSSGAIACGSSIRYHAGVEKPTGDRHWGGSVSELRQIGPYRILEWRGEGGMGVVYRAEQREPIRREVAIKVIREDRASKEFSARFTAERAALERMNHPNIARVLDSGVTD